LSGENFRCPGPDPKYFHKNSKTLIGKERKIMNNTYHKSKPKKISEVRR
jgi:hypothetical protein